MSIAAITWVLGNRRNEPGLRGPKNAQRLVLLVLANYADEEGEAWPGMDTIAQEANLTRNTTKTALAWLIDHGYLEREVKAGKPRRGSRQARNVYRLRWEAEREGTNIDPSPDEPEGPESDTERGRNSRDRGDEIRAVDVITPSSVNPSDTKGEPATSTSVDALTVNQRAKRMLDKFWQWHASDYGRDPSGIAPMAFRSLMAHFLGAGFRETEIAAAVKVLWRAGRPLTKPTIAAELEQRRPGTVRPSIDEQLDALSYGPDGMLAV